MESNANLSERATFLTSEGDSALLPASARDQIKAKRGMIMMRLIYLECLARFCHDEESYITKQL